MFLSNEHLEGGEGVKDITEYQKLLDIPAEDLKKKSDELDSIIDPIIKFGSIHVDV